MSKSKHPSMPPIDLKYLEKVREAWKDGLNKGIQDPEKYWHEKSEKQDKLIRQIEKDKKKSEKDEKKKKKDDEKKSKKDKSKSKKKANDATMAERLVARYESED